MINGYDKTIKRVPKEQTISYIHNVGKQPLKPLTLGQLIEECCTTYPNVTAIISKHQNQELSYLQALDRADRLAAGLKSLGLNNGDRVAIWAPNCIEWYITHMACARAGFVLVNINPAIPRMEMEYCIKKVEMRCIICAHKFKYQNYYEILCKIAPELPGSIPGKLKSRHVPSLQSVIVMTDEHLRGALKFNDVFEFATIKGIRAIKESQNLILMDEPAHIQFTSGTTGQPKAAAVSHFSMVNNSYYIGQRSELDRKHHTICVQTPLFHAIGTVITICAALNHGATLVLPSAGYDPDKNLDAIRDERCTVIHGTPTMYVDLVDRQKKRRENISPDIAVSGGACCSPHLFREMKSVLNLQKVKSVYGLTECTAIVFQSLYDDDEYLSTSTVGYVQDHVEAKVTDVDGNIVPIGTPGELCIRGYSTMLGYWKDEDRTKEVIGPDKWFRTGDQFILEKNGYGKIVGRLKEMIIRGGENIFPKEIEDFLNTHPSILEVYVVGIPHERLGEEVCAFVKVKDGMSVTLDHIRTYCKENIAHFKIPTVLKIVDSFPKTTSGKIQKYRLVQIAVKDANVVAN
ncbi:medium-chain acyl-CoA ligase ACSF2, mitochondrial-like [Cylas formicarius]|uniref:medium-chain acyl-CoA ligase ACSF2, mitochondrial-like n=1 Tax=Cylas formicarius TaxID=197179 RepID=UPI002958DEE2|nr:medium-chain acyl-CoA ligase ACSF2, mitochondrial-like [Cylas formicarius]